jgi:hypothetical protein
MPIPALRNFRYICRVLQLAGRRVSFEDGLRGMARALTAMVLVPGSDGARRHHRCSLAEPRPDCWWSASTSPMV